MSPGDRPLVPENLLGTRRCPSGTAAEGSDRMSDQERLGRLDDEEEAAEQPSKTDGPSAAGEYDPAEGSPGSPHPAPQEETEAVTRYDTDTTGGSTGGSTDGTGAGDGGTGS
jgi:hypothetical protein